MIPGTVSKLSLKLIAPASTVVADTDIIYTNGAGQIDYLIPKAAGFAQKVVIIPATDLNIGVGGNIGIGSSINQPLQAGRASSFYYVPFQGRWAQALY